MVYDAGCPIFLREKLVADPSHYAVRHRLEVKDAESVEKLGGTLTLTVPHRLSVEGLDERVEGVA